MEDTLVLLKPDAMERGLAGSLIERFERKGFRIVAMKLFRMTPELAALHYPQHVNRDFYPELEAYITRSPLVALILRGRKAVATVRSMVGITDGADAAPGTIRGDLTLDFRENLVHASDSPESAKREIAHFFHLDEIYD